MTDRPALLLLLRCQARKPAAVSYELLPDNSVAAGHIISQRVAAVAAVAAAAPVTAGVQRMLQVARPGARGKQALSAVLTELRHETSLSSESDL